MGILKTHLKILNNIYTDRLKDNRLKRIFLIKKIKNFFQEVFSKKYVLISSSVSPGFYNWGDDVNSVLVELINPSLKAIPRLYSFNFRRKKDYVCIGSIITWMTTPRSVIWGSGVQLPEKEITYKGKVIKPHKVLAVRGPLTREYLLKRNIECPEIYGDPALLFPRYYQSPALEKKKYKYGVIPHFKDKKSISLQKFIDNEDFHIIDIQDFKDWRNFIDQINACEFIISSSLHGIIIADAYNVPNCWVEFDRINLKRFTFQDYFVSVQKPISEPFNINEINSEEDILKIKDQWNPPVIDLDKLMAVCPFNK